MTGPNEYYATEYHRRNMQVARVCGANASVDLALKRALANKSTPNWIIAYLESAASRLPGLQHDLAAWRDLSPDAPDVVKQKSRAVLAALPEVQAIVRQAVEAEREAIMPEHVIRVAAMMIDSLHCLDTEAIQIADATNKSGGVDGVQVLEDAEKIIKAAAGLVATELRGIAAIRKRGEG